MTRQWLLGVALAAALLTPAVARAHGGHVHKVMGTVSSVDGNHVMVKTKDGKDVMVMLDAKTKITQGKTTVDATALTVGTRIVAEGADEKGMLTAARVQVGTVPAAKAPAAKTGAK
jgi:hypothetical protein